MEVLERVCPLCGSDQPIEFLRCDVSNKLNDDQFAIESWRGFRKDQIHFDYFRCACCSLIYNREYFSERALESLYSKMDDNLRGSSEVSFARTQKSYIDAINNDVPITGRWLDIGADVGFASAALLSAGATQVDAVEPNAAVHATLKQALNTGLIRISLDELSEFKYDGVIAVHVLDHVRHPRDELAKVRSIAVDNARLSVVVHDVGSLLRKAMGKNWPPFCLQHPQLYDENTLRILLKEAGFLETQIRKTVNWYRFNDGLADVLSNYSFTRLAKAARKIELPQLPVRLGNIQATALSG